MEISKHALLEALPITSHEITLRLWEREDLDRLALWPSYPFPYEAFHLPYDRMTPMERDEQFHSRNADSHQIVLIADHETQGTIAFLGLRVEMDEQNRVIGNVGLRVEPSWCDRGIGTLLLRTVADWCFAQGMQSLRLDVAASNARAIRCYEKAGFAITGEFWRDAEDLKDADTSQPAYAFLQPHLRRTGATPQIRFWWMQRDATQSGGQPLDRIE